MHSEPFTCLSDKPHDSRVSDVRLHYSGCSRVSDRSYFLNALSPEDRQSILRQQERTRKRRDRLETTHRDSTAGEQLAEFKEALAHWYISKGRRHSPYPVESRPPSSLNGLLAAADDVDADVKASIMYFKNAQPYDVPTLPNSFPNQSLSVKELLTDDPANNPLMQPCDEDTVRYFHFPANNMSWVEEAMARYYHETKPDSDDLFVKARFRRSRTRTETLLRPEYWQGQQGFEDNAEVHARHMRPFCGLLSSDPIPSTISAPRNTVLFMPYLHWETDRGRIRSAGFIKEASRHKLMSVSEVVEQAQQKDEDESKEEKPPSSKARLARVFLSAAALYEAMELQTEEQLIYKYLYAKAPLHPRRTLDQSYYGALKSTGARDRDQVVYRGTTPETHDCAGTKCCKLCQDDSRKVSRLIMVDQLWLWILDENTVITFCPRRFGKHKPDPSAIHKSIRGRLKYASNGEISSAYDLALVIIDQCSRVFFDRARANDRQPNMTELFASAIRGVTYKQTAAFDQFLIYTHLASGQYKRDRSTDATAQNTLLNINPEGKLLKEVKDIMDEIHIMLRIQEQQQIVLEGFVDQIKQTLAGHHRLLEPLKSDRSTIQDRPITAAGLYDEHDVPVNVEGDRQRRDQPRRRARGTLARAEFMLTDLEERKLELNALLANARNTSTALKDLLTLKQQQAGVIEAREAVKQAAETLKQGQSIMLFTVITIIFLPLSFFATIFGMNSKELNDGRLTLVQEFVYMFPISAGIIVTSFLLAFSRSLFHNSLVVLVRNAFSFVFNTAITWVSVKTGLYLFGRSMSSTANRLKDKENKATSAMKADVMRRKAYLEKMRAASAITDIVGARTTAGAGRLTNEAGVTQRTFGLSSPVDGAMMGERLSSSAMGSRSRSPLMSPMTQQKGGLLGVTEYDVELGQWDRQSVSRDGSGPRPF